MASRTEPTSPSVSLGSCQPPGGGSRGLAGPQPGVPVLPAPHLRRHPGLLALAACLSAHFDLPFSLSPPTCVFSLSFFFCAPFFLSLASPFPLFFEMASLILDLSLIFLVFSPTQPLLSLDCLHMKGCSPSELQSWLSSLRHTNLSQTIAPIFSPTFALSQNFTKGGGLVS